MVLFELFCLRVKINQTLVKQVGRFVVEEISWHPERLPSSSTVASECDWHAQDELERPSSVEAPDLIVFSPPTVVLRPTPSVLRQVGRFSLLDNSDKSV